jgi:hypothetical protein
MALFIRFLCAVNNGQIITTTGLPTNYNLFVDPQWFYETKQKEDFAHGLENWSAFGTKGVEVSAHPDKQKGSVLSLRKPELDWPAGAAWNFPSGTKGSLRLRILIKPGFAGARIGITDHFSVPFDDLDEFYNLYSLPISAEGQIGKAKLTPNRWHTVQMKWDTDQRRCRIWMDGHEVTVLRQSRETLGANYLRLISTAETTDLAGMLVEDIEANVVRR